MEFDSADYDYARILRERKLPLLGEGEPLEQPEIPPENIDFLMQFLNQTPLPDYEGAEDLIDEQVENETDYDASLPFERRPAIEKPDAISITEEELSTKEKSRTGHITWRFKSPIPNNKNEMEKKLMTREELEQRIRTELDLPHFKAQIDDQRDYSEDDYQEFKDSLVNYYKNYVQDIDTDFQGGLD